LADDLGGQCQRTKLTIAFHGTSVADRRRHVTTEPVVDAVEESTKAPFFIQTRGYRHDPNIASHLRIGWSHRYPRRHDGCLSGSRVGSAGSKMEEAAGAARESEANRENNSAPRRGPPERPEVFPAPPGARQCRTRRWRT